MKRKIALISGILILVLGALTFIFFYIFNEPEDKLEDYKLGDKIILKINTNDQNEISKIFTGFEIEKIELIEEPDSDISDKSIPEIDKSYLVTIRSFELGEKEISYRGEELKFNIVTNIKENEKKLYLDYTDKSIKRWRGKIPFNLLIGVVLFSYAIWLYLKREKPKRMLTPFERYIMTIRNLSENYPFEISYAVREYIDSNLKTNFMKGEYISNNLLSHGDIDFIRELDYVKFSHKATLTLDESVNRANQIVKKIQEYIRRQEEAEVGRKKNK